MHEFISKIFCQVLRGGGGKARVADQGEEEKTAGAAAATAAATAATSAGTEKAGAEEVGDEEAGKLEEITKVAKKM